MRDPRIYTNTSPAGVQGPKNLRRIDPQIPAGVQGSKNLRKIDPWTLGSRGRETYEKSTPGLRPDWCWCISSGPALRRPLQLYTKSMFDHIHRLGRICSRAWPVDMDNPNLGSVPPQLKKAHPPPTNPPQQQQTEPSQSHPTPPKTQRRGVTNPRLGLACRALGAGDTIHIRRPGPGTNTG